MKNIQTFFSCIKMKKKFHDYINRHVIQIKHLNNQQTKTIKSKEVVVNSIFKALPSIYYFLIFSKWKMVLVKLIRMKFWALNVFQNKS